METLLNKNTSGVLYISFKNKIATQTRFSGIKRENFQKFEAFPRKTPVWLLRVKVVVVPKNRSL